MITRFLLWVSLDWVRNPLSWLVLTGVVKYWEMLFKKTERFMTTQEVIQYHFWLEDLKSELFFYWSYNHDSTSQS